MRRIITATTVATAVLALCACNRESAPAASGATPPSPAEAAAIVEASEATFTSGDAARIMAQYAEGAVMFDAGRAQPTDDRATQRRLTEAFARMGLSEMQIADKHVQVLDGDTIVASGIGTFDLPGGSRVSIRYSDVYQKQPDGRWLIVHEHLSMPPATPAAPDPEAQGNRVG